MNLHLAQHVALVTGAAGGIGSAIADALASEGCHVALVDRNAESLERVACNLSARGVGILPLMASVENRAEAEHAVQQAIEHFGRLDILVCCAGIARDGVSWKLSEDDWDDVIAVNLTGCFNFARAAAPVLRARGSGRIINITSINGLRGKFGQSNYAASKAGVIGLTKTLARELGRFGITVNAVAPGMVLTPMTRSLGAEVMNAASNEAVLGRLTEPDDIADAVLFLSSDRAHQITGEVLRVDGGQYL